MTDINTLIADMRAGLEGVTPGEWRVSFTHELTIQADDKTTVAYAGYGENDEDLDDCIRMARDAAHIARCSPSNIRALLDEIERLRRERDEARARALEEAANVAREYWTAVIERHGHIPADPVEAMTKAAQEIESAILWMLPPIKGTTK